MGPGADELSTARNCRWTRRRAPADPADDHARRATDAIDHARERINGLLQADLTEQSNQLNDVTRKLAAWAAIIAVPTALTGYFGQNVPYPGYGTGWGFLLSLVLIVASGTGLYWFLKHRGWL